MESATVRVSSILSGVGNEISNGAFRDVVQILYQGFRYLSWHMRKFIFTYTNQSNMASPAPICTKLKNAQQH
jgi:hypothetical protein